VHTHTHTHIHREKFSASKEVGLEVNIEKTKYKLVTPHQNAGQDQDIQIASKLFENVSQIKYVGMIITIKI
jgi:hypothetical protein